MFPIFKFHLGILDGLRDFVTAKKKPILGICVGMQLFSSFGDEDGGSDGLGWIKGKVKKISLKDLSLKLPHMGWNNIQISSNSKLLKALIMIAIFILFIVILLMLMKKVCFSNNKLFY